MPDPLTTRAADRSPLRYPLDTYPKVFVIMCRHPNKNRITDDGILAYGFPGQPFPGSLLHRGPGMAFKTNELARQALACSLRRDKAAGATYVDKCRFEIVPVYLGFGRKRKAVTT
jgi:hypothetical protein